MYCTSSLAIRTNKDYKEQKVASPPLYSKVCVAAVPLILALVCRSMQDSGDKERYISDMGRRWLGASKLFYCYCCMLSCTTDVLCALAGTSDNQYHHSHKSVKAVTGSCCSKVPRYNESGGSPSSCSIGLEGINQHASSLNQFTVAIWGKA